MANDEEDGNRLRYVVFKKCQDVSFSKVCCSVDVLQEIAFNHSVGAN